MSGLMPVGEALATIALHARELESVTASLAQAHGRVLRQDALADLDSPPFDCSAMDGFAVCEPAINGCYSLVGEIAAGSDILPPLGPGECVRVFTGAKVPGGATRVVMQEDAVLEGASVRVNASSTATHVRRQAENCRAGDVVVPAGTRLGIVDLAALAACGITEPIVVRPPRVVHFVTGDELVSPDAKPIGAQIRDSNSVLVAAFLQSVGADLVHQQRLGDDLQNAQAALSGAPDHDLLLISGGASVGSYDISKPLLRNAGFELLFERLDLRPGKPLAFGVRGRQLAFAMPGNPVSHWVVLELFISSALRFMSSLPGEPQTAHGRLKSDFRASPNARQTYWPCKAEGALLTPLGFTSSGDVTGLLGANALLPVAPGTDFISSREDVEFVICTSDR